MELSNESIKNNLKIYLNEKGVKNIWVANKINISPTSVCLFLKGERELPQDKLKEIYELITK